MSPFEAGLIVATEEGRKFAETGRDVVASRLTNALVGAGYDAPDQRTIDACFQVSILNASDTIREIAEQRGCTPEQAEEIVGTFLVAAAAGRTQ